MPFKLVKEDELEFFSEQADLPDRIVGLVFPILVDRRLELLIRDCWNDTANGELLDELFRDSGALGSFQTRVQVGFAVGLYDEGIFDDLRLIVKIRNAFAHQPRARSFDAQPICDLTRSLQLPDRYPKEDQPITGTREQRIERLMQTSGLIDLAPLRHRFLRTTEIALTWLSIKSGDFDLPPP